MKDKILVFIIGLLVGAVITASGFLIYEKVNKNTNQIPNGEKMQMMEPPNGEEPPEKPSGENNQDKSNNKDNSQNRPEMPQKNNSSSDNKKE